MKQALDFSSAVMVLKCALHLGEFKNSSRKTKFGHVTL